ncbi:zinc finger E-box-binding homeobox 1-like [Limulus polyphemus]|uniref:Zinc finger E-box-binding homeobox 1-like n=1 Tax=Limulus polyphemus TaxID=6850 RepID=A0ABM1SIC0_LIMPO|nr:zinc finger E-box-binding homeobox 1-like [Limulus polyphemus]
MSSSGTLTQSQLTNIRSTMPISFDTAQSQLTEPLKTDSICYQDFQEEKQREHEQQECLSQVTSPGNISVTSSPALPIESATVNHSSEKGVVSVDDVSFGEDTDENSISNDSNELNYGENKYSNPLAQLHNVLEKNGVPNSKLGFSVINSTSTKYSTPVNNSEGGIISNTLPSMREDDVTGEVYRCHLCSYSGTSTFHFNCHMNSHFNHKCPFCDYIAKTEGRLKRHVKDFHSEVHPDSWNGQRVPRKKETHCDTLSRTSNGKLRHYRCKQCEYISVKKTDFWEHCKTHIKTEKLLTCPKCPFVTEYKHHLEYHLRNHFGSKPFKCPNCNYSCVNKSMLSSHMKSHSNIYQYRCADCSYASKYCHSLKLHLRKYSHKPATILNRDGTPNPFPIIDVYGRKRGPRPKKQKIEEHHYPSLNQSPNTSVTQMTPRKPPPATYPPMPTLIPSPTRFPFAYPPHATNGLHRNMFLLQPLVQKAVQPPNGLFSDSTPVNTIDVQRSLSPKINPVRQKCNICDFTTEIKDVFSKHMLVHVASDNQDLCKLYGITSESLLQIQDPIPVNGRQDLKENFVDQDEKRENYSLRNESPKPPERKISPHSTDYVSGGLAGKVSSFQFPPKCTEPENLIVLSHFSQGLKCALASPPVLTAPVNSHTSVIQSEVFSGPVSPIKESHQVQPDALSPLDLSSNRDSSKPNQETSSSIPSQVHAQLLVQANNSTSTSLIVPKSSPLQPFSTLSPEQASSKSNLSNFSLLDPSQPLSSQSSKLNSSQTVSSHPLNLAPSQPVSSPTLNLAPSQPVSSYALNLAPSQPVSSYALNLAPSQPVSSPTLNLAPSQPVSSPTLNLAPSQPVSSPTLNLAPSQPVSSHTLNLAPSQPVSFHFPKFDEHLSLSSSKEFPATVFSVKFTNTSAPSSNSRNRRKGKAVKLDRRQFVIEDKYPAENLMECDKDVEDEQITTAEASRKVFSMKSPGDLNVISVPTYKAPVVNALQRKVLEREHLSHIDPVSVSTETTRISKPAPQLIVANPMSVTRMPDQSSALPNQMSSLFLRCNGLNTTHNDNVIISKGYYPSFICHGLTTDGTTQERPIYSPSQSSLPLRQNGTETKKTPSPKNEEEKSKWQDAYTCSYCDMAFIDCIMYTMHMGYHGYQDPFTCNMCGQQNKDKVSFFLHIARVAHQ